MFFLYLLSIVCAYLLYKYFTVSFDYWKEKNIIYEKPRLIFGNYTRIILNLESLSEKVREIYKKYPEEKLVGLFQLRRPQLVVKDLNLIKHVLVKDFNHFFNRTILDSYGKDPLSHNLFRMTDIKWRVMRKKLTPIFSSGKLRTMFSLVVEKGEEFQKYIDELIVENNELEIRDLLSQLTTDVIGSIAFGIETGSMSNKDSEFRHIGKQIVTFSILRRIRFLFKMVCPTVFEFFNMQIQSAEVSNFFVKTVKDMVKYREDTNYHRNDFLNLLIELKKQNKLAIDENEILEFDDFVMTGQAFVFFVAGFETSSVLMSCALHELVLQPHIMEKVVKEIDTVLEKHGKLTYDAVQDMIYLDMVIQETLRKYPAGSVLSRVCTENYTFPDTNVTIDKNTEILIPVLEIHYDPKYYPDPQKFIPERFSHEEKSKRHPMTFLSFGEGPRNCIGMRFGKMQSMVGIISILRKYKVEMGKKTEKKIKINMKSFVTSPAHGSWLKFTPRNIDWIF